MNAFDIKTLGASLSFLRKLTQRLPFLSYYRKTCRRNAFKNAAVNAVHAKVKHGVNVAPQRPVVTSAQCLFCDTFMGQTTRLRKTKQLLILIFRSALKVIYHL